jgi:xylan 1,4-beta-xylosidase
MRLGEATDNIKAMNQNTKKLAMLFVIFLWTSIAGARATELSLTVSVNSRQVIGTNDQFWANAVFHPTEFLDSDWGKEHLGLLRSGGVTLKFVRIYNQPEDAAYLKDDGSIGYRWDHFDRRADMILAQGCRLLVAFFSMPQAILADQKAVRERTFLNGKKIYIGPPKDYRQWQEACADFTRHVIARYGVERVAQWRFTCWNEPDHSGFWRADLVEYRKLYDHFAAGVKSVCSRIPIGGPALTSWRPFKHPEIFRDFLQHVVSTGSPIDYLAVHTYGGHGGRGSSECKFPSVDYLIEQQRRLVKMRDEFPELRSVPIVVDEWGVTSEGSKGMDKQPLAEVRNTSYAPAFLATMVARHINWRLTENPRVSDLFVCLSGYEKQRQRDFEGKRTVQTVHGFDKPILNGYRLLARLGDEWVACRVEPSGEHLSAIAARDGQRQLAVVVTHFQNDRPHNSGPSQPVKIELDTPWPDGTRAELRHWRIDEEHSNAYTIFRQLGRPAPPTPQQSEQIKKRMGLEQLEKPRAMTIRGKLEVQFDLPCNAVSLVELIKQP